MPDTGNKKSENFLGCINLFLVAVNILITAFLGLYLAQRNEEFQKQLIDIQSKAKLAQIDIIHEQQQPENYGGYLYYGKDYGYITFRNSGISTAENLRMSICLYTVSSLWNPVINDITQFVMDLSDTSRKYEIELAKTGCGYESATGTKNDTAFVNLETLPPGESVTVRISTGTIPHKTTTTNREAFAIIDKSISTNQFAFDFKEIEKYINGPFLADNYYVAQFRGSASCTNCTVSNDDGIALATESTLVLTKNPQVLFEDSKIVEVTFDLTLEYFTPEGYSNPKNETPIFFQIDRYSKSPQFEEIYKETYDKLKQ